MRLEPEDYVLYDSGPLLSRTSVAAEGKFIGEYPGLVEALKAVRLRMSNENFYPDVWYIDDHGGTTLVRMTEETEDPE